MDLSPRFSLAYLQGQQAQKHVTVNEALRRLDALVSLSVKSRTTSAEPASPMEGDAYIITASPTGAAWAGFAPDAVAAFQDGAWAEIAPVEGLRAYVVDEGALVAYSGSAWDSVGGGVGSPAMLGVNASADVTNRFAVKSDAALFSHDDVTPGSGDMRHIVNKAASANTASVLFQTGFSGHAEFGLTGDDDFHLKVSGDGASWNDAFVIAAASGDVEIGQNLSIARDTPADFWSGAASGKALWMPYGYFGTNGSYALGLWWNGYRNSSGSWTSQAIAGLSSGAGIELQNAGIYFRWESSVAGVTPAIIMQAKSAYVSPGSDNAQSCGAASLRWSQVYAASGSISTSDAREKTVDGPLDEAEKRAARRILSTVVKFRWNDAVERKGDAARIHVGVTAQSVAEAFAAEGLDASRYGVWCEDEIMETVDDGETGVTERASGQTCQGVRYDQLFVFLIAALAE
ncbi:MAG: DUF2793 domain-containing protein [Parvularculaceae bacterium]